MINDPLIHFKLHFVAQFYVDLNFNISRETIWWCFCLRNSILCADPKRQLYLAVIAVFDSWNSPRAKKYRRINRIKGLKGTAVNVQCMVFGNMGDTSGTGVLFTRNPCTGEKQLFGEFLINAQVVCILIIFCLHSILKLFILFILCVRSNLFKRY